ncbi:MAG: hypothetical protein AB2L18_11880 [Anaerolineaceae bacterium]
MIDYSVNNICFIFLFLFSKKIFERNTEKRVSELQQITENKSEKIKPTWDLARITIEAYFSKNLSQISAIFCLSVFVMVIGFEIIIFGITSALITQNNTLPIIITSISGIITESIGATFLLFIDQQ